MEEESGTDMCQVPILCWEDHNSLYNYFFNLHDNLFKNVPVVSTVDRDTGFGISFI